MESHPLGTICAFAFRLFFKSANSFCAVASTTIQLIVLLIFSISSASAAVFYQYTGNNLNSIGVAPPLSEYDTSMSVRVSFVVDSLLINVSDDISPLVTNYTFFEGLHTFTEANSVLGDFTVTTDSLGNITDWSIEVSNIDPADPTARIGDRLISIATSVNTDKGRMLDCFDVTASGLCIWQAWDGASVSNDPGSWSVVSIPQVPIPPAPCVTGAELAWEVPNDVMLTSDKHDGNFGSYQAMNAWIQRHGCKCYHVCNYSEVSAWLQTRGGSVFTEHAWINSPGVYGATGRVGDCRGWSPIAGDVGTIIARSAGKTFPARHYCSRPFKVACCR